MKPVHHREKEHFKKLFHQEHIDQFEDRFKILEVFLQTEKHITAQEMHRLLTENGIRLPYEFLKQTLEMMCRYGFAQKRKFQDGQTRYEHRHLGQHHDHMICTRCGNILEFKNDDLERLQFEIATASGFHMLQHKMEIYGICAGCQALRAGLIPLSNAKPGERLIISEFVGGKMSLLRLISMGLREGEQVDVITNSHQGQVVLAIGYNRLSIGQGLARKVLVRPVSRN
jgi:Fur family transcriptional regulator, ferric uptake regulator